MIALKITIVIHSMEFLRIWKNLQGTATRAINASQAKDKDRRRTGKGQPLLFCSGSCGSLFIQWPHGSFLGYPCAFAVS